MNVTIWLQSTGYNPHAYKPHVHNLHVCNYRHVCRCLQFHMPQIHITTIHVTIVQRIKLPETEEDLKTIVEKVLLKCLYSSNVFDWQNNSKNF